jgi:hypothetical protein
VVGMAESCLGGLGGKLLHDLRRGCRDGSVLLPQLGRAVEGIRSYGRGGASVSCSASVAIVLVARHLRASLLFRRRLVRRVWERIGVRVGHGNWS